MQVKNQHVIFIPTNVHLLLERLINWARNTSTSVRPYQLITREVDIVRLEINQPWPLFVHTNTCLLGVHIHIHVLLYM